jgi:UDP-N-acetylmuramoyl-tripeptide--D-alanyl-D-alanine ligase
MRELGHAADEHHRALAAPIADAAVDLVFCCGEHMRALFDGLPAEQRGGHTRTSLELVPLLQAVLQPGDVVTIKGSLGTNMAPLVKAVRN